MQQQPSYPWMTIVRGADLEQGDLLRDCPRFLLPADALSKADIVYSRGNVDAVILTQSCDLAIRADGKCEATEVLLCPFFTRKDLTAHPQFHKDEFWEEVQGTASFLPRLE